MDILHMACHRSQHTFWCLEKMAQSRKYHPQASAWLHRRVPSGSAMKGQSVLSFLGKGLCKDLNREERQ